MNAQITTDKLPLIFKSVTANKTEIQNLLDAGADVNSTDSRGRTALHWAAHFEIANVDAVELLLEHGAIVDARDDKQRTPLHTAGVDTARKLLAAGADANAQTIYGMTPLILNLMGNRMDFCEILLRHPATNVNAQAHQQGPLTSIVHLFSGEAYPEGLTYASALHVATVANNFGGVNMLLEHGADIDIQDHEGQTPLMFAAILSFKDMVKHLIDAGANINAADNLGNMALHLTRDDAVMDILLKSVANVAARDHLGRTPLHSARDANIARRLLDAGADANAQDIDGRTPLHSCMEEAAIPVIQILLQHYTSHQKARVHDGAYVNAADSAGIVAMHMAAASNNFGGVNILLEHGAVIDARNKAGQTPLMYAAFASFKDMVKYLIDAGADINIADHSGITALHLTSDEAVMNILLKHGADTAVRDSEGTTPLHSAKDANIARRLLDAGADANAQDIDGRTPLHWCVEAGELSVIQILLNHPTTHVNARMHDGRTPLILAAEFANEDVIETLLDAGADINAADNRESRTALHWAVASNKACGVDILLKYGANVNAKAIRSGRTSLHFAAAFRTEARIVRSLLDAGADVNIQDNHGRTPLFVATGTGSTHIILMLLRQPATNPNTRSYDGDTLLTVAVIAALEVVLENLINAGADINATDSNGKMALHWAAHINQVEAVRILLKCGANADARDHKGRTPLFFAAREGNLEACRILLRRFANRDIGDYRGKLPREVANERFHADIVSLLNNEFMPAG